MKPAPVSHLHHAPLSERKKEGRKRMPNIGGKKFSYTKEGMKKAGMYKAKIKKKTKAKSKKKSV